MIIPRLATPLGSESFLRLSHGIGVQAKFESNCVKILDGLVSPC
jgi:hypothetical protein